MRKSLRLSVGADIVGVPHKAGYTTGALRTTCPRKTPQGLGIGCEQGIRVRPVYCVGRLGSGEPLSLLKVVVACNITSNLP